MTSGIELYSAVFAVSVFSAGLLTPLARAAALRWGVLDHPATPIKTHRVPVPYLGGAAIFVTVAAVLAAFRFLTNYPTGTLRSLWAILSGGFFIFAVGLADDLTPGGMNFRWKFFFQFLAAGILLLFDIRLHFIQPVWLAQVVTVLWVVGVTNAFNLVDIMDGLSASQALVACLGFFFIALPGEAVYVNVAAASVAGACLGFLPFNFSTRYKIFMGDAGSLFLGFSLAVISLGTTYTATTEFGLFAPFLILGFPLYDTFFVSVLRIAKGLSPFLGSKDHLALKLRHLGNSPRRVVAMMAVVSSFFTGLAFLVTRLSFFPSFFLLVAVLAAGIYAVVRLRRVEVP